ncbi:MAG: prephenate dehydrogenase [Chloroflexota bacterium]
MTLRRLGVIGTGLIGASIAGAARRSGARVQAFDLAPERLEIATARGMIDEARASLEDAVEAVDAVVLAMPIAAIIHSLPAVDTLAAPGSLIVDVGSVKRPVLESMEGLPGARRTVGGHPIAGRETGGPASADIDLFRDKPFVLVPTSRTSSTALAAARELAEMVGARPLVTDAELHDEVLARTSHLPQLLSTALGLTLEPGDGRLSGSGLHDMTRLASSDPEVWRDILIANDDRVSEALRRCLAHLNRLADAIERRAGEEIARILTEGKDRAAAERMESPA